MPLKPKLRESIRNRNPPNLIAVSGDRRFYEVLTRLRKPLVL